MAPSLPHWFHFRSMAPALTLGACVFFLTSLYKCNWAHYPSIHLCLACQVLEPNFWGTKRRSMWITFEYIFIHVIKYDQHSFFYFLYVEKLLLCFIDPRMRKSRNDASSQSCPGIFFRIPAFIMRWLPWFPPPLGFLPGWASLCWPWNLQAGRGGGWGWTGRGVAEKKGFLGRQYLSLSFSGLLVISRSLVLTLSRTMRTLSTHKCSFHFYNHHIRFLPEWEWQMSFSESWLAAPVALESSAELSAIKMSLSPPVSPSLWSKHTSSSSEGAIALQEITSIYLH